MSHEHEDIEQKLQFLGLSYLQNNWNQVLKDANKQKHSYHRFLSQLIEREYAEKQERKRKLRLQRANIPESLVMETFPFNKQPKLRKQFVMELYDSLEYMTNAQDMLFIGPTGCGKTGLATAYLIHAINQGYRGYFTDFSDLLDNLYRSIADHSEEKIIKKFSKYDILVIDEMGYNTIDPEKASLFFNLMKKRHKTKTTLITTQLGYDEWGNFIQDEHMLAGLVNRLTENIIVFDMQKCKSLRPKNIRHATKKE